MNTLALFDLEDIDTDPDPEPVHPLCVRCDKPEPEGETYGWELWSGFEAAGGVCSKCLLGD